MLDESQGEKVPKTLELRLSTSPEFEDIANSGFRLVKAISGFALSDKAG